MSFANFWRSRQACAEQRARAATCRCPGSVGVHARGATI